jgi:hypothetical protein
VISPRTVSMARVVLALAPACLLIGCQGAGSSYPLMSIPGVTRIPPPGSWQRSGDPKYYPDLSRPASAAQSADISSYGRRRGNSLNWVPFQGQPTASSGVVAATYERPVDDQPVGSGVLVEPVRPGLLQPPIDARPLRPSEEGASMWSSRHDPR